MAGHDLFRPSFTILYAVLTRLRPSGGSLWSRRIQISHPQELESKLSEALEQVRNNRLVFVDVTVDGSEHVYPMQIRGGGMDEMWLSKTERT